MLPPQLRSGTAVSKHRSITTLQASTTTSRNQFRTIFKGPNRWDFLSHLDPTYHRYARVRTLKTRARLLKSLQRRQSFEWDVDTKPFFTPRNLRWASHWRGRQWYSNDDPREQLRKEAEEKERKGANGEGEREGEGEGYELSRREKEWKEQMERMRERIQRDPYEAVFGKRFEPFWGPLVPSWMREEMGLPSAVEAAKKTSGEAEKGKKAGSPSLEDLQGRMEALVKPDESVKARKDQKTSDVKARNQPAAALQSESNDVLDELRRRIAETTKSSTASSSSPKPFSRMTTAERQKHVNSIVGKEGTIEAKAQCTPKSSSYAYASSTSWDSVSNKTKKVEWDSTSNQTKTFEYDPISNRMVQVEPPNKVAIDSDSSAVRQPEGETKGSASALTKLKGMLVDQSSDVRKAIPIPPPLSQPSQSVTLGYTQTAVGRRRSTAVSSASVKPAALAKLPPQDLDLLTADNVRATMGKTKQSESVAKPSTAEEKAQLERDFDNNARSQDAEVDAVLKERIARKTQPQATSWWDQAEIEYLLQREIGSVNRKKEKLMSDEKGLFHIERQKREVAKLDERLEKLLEKARSTALVVPQHETPKPSALRELKTALERGVGSKAATSGNADRSPLKEMKTALRQSMDKKPISILQSSVERMQSRKLPQAAEQDLDDAAAHESTEPIQFQTGVPREWTKQADLLQADRVQRTADKRPYPKTRWLDDMNARKVAYEHRKAEAQAAEDAKNAESNARREKTRQLLEAEIAETKLKMQAFEGRYMDKVKALRGELHTAFKQSSVHSEKHVERIRELESQVEGLRATVTKYAGKVNSLKEELERAYKQSAVHAEKHLERIRYLEGELASASSAVPPSAGRSKPEIMPAEGDLCLNAPKFGENGKWYKRPANPAHLTVGEIEKATDEAQDQALVDEVRDIYEKRYGLIETGHEQPRADNARPSTLQDLQINLSKVVESPTAKRESPKATSPKQEEKLERMRRELDKETDARSEKMLSKTVAKLEKKIEERASQAEDKARQVVEVESDVDLGEELAKYEKEHPEAYRAEQNSAAPESAEKMKTVIASSLENEIKTPEPVAPTTAGIQWADPPLYKILAYDSGNDMMSSATTTASILPGSAEERPLGIPEALGQLYQPARFVPYFAELQSESFQAIAATREVVVFRQVKKAAEPAREAEKEVEQEAIKEDVNPIDTTLRRDMRPATGNFASPTGFVNHDPVFPAKPQQPTTEELDAVRGAGSDTYSTVAKEPSAKTSRQIWEGMKGSGRTPVKRQESVFSGMNRSERQTVSEEIQQAAQERNRLRNLAKKEAREKARAGKEEQAATRTQPSQHQRDEEPVSVLEQTGQREPFEKSKSDEQSSESAWSITFGYFIGACLGTAGLLYLVGMLEERERAADAAAREGGGGSGNWGKKMESFEMKERIRRMRLEKQMKELEDEAARLTREWEKR